MKVTVERLPESRALLDITADDDEFSRAMDRAYRQVAKEVVIPGFRRGKAPRGVIERMYGRGVFLEEANKELMTDLYRRAIKEQELVPVGDPEVELVAAEPLAFKVTVPVFPSVEPGPYAEVRVEPVDAAVDEAAVEEVVERLRRGQSPWVDPADEGMELGRDLVLTPKARLPREGDQVTIDYAIRDAGADEPLGRPVEDAVFVLGESSLLPRLREEIERLRVGESSRFEIAYAADDEAVDPEVRGKTLAYEVTLKGLKERDLLPLDDDFAREVGEVETLAELRQEIRDDLHQGRTAEARTEVLTAIVARMGEGATIELPAAMIDQGVEEDLNGLRSRLAQRRSSLEEYLRLNEQGEDELRAELRPSAEQRLRNSLLLREVAQREGIAVADAEIDAEVERLSAVATGGADPARARELYRSGFFRNVLRDDLFERRLNERLIDLATEGRGAVLNGWVEPEPDSDAANEAEFEAESAAPEASANEMPGGAEADQEPDPTVSVAEAHEAAPEASVTAETALADAPTLGTMPGQPGDLAEVEVAAPAVETADVADAPDVAQAAAAGHETENAAVDAGAPEGAVTPEEREARGEPGPDGELPTPTY